MKRKPQPSPVNGYTPVDLVMNIMSPCQKCGIHQTRMWIKNKDGKRIVSCFECIQK